MELLIFGYGGTPVVVFPTSGGRFYDFEDRGMVAALAEKIDLGQLQLYCVDSVDKESWYNRAAHPRLRIARQKQYDEYIRQEVVLFIRRRNMESRLVTAGCSFGGYHAVNTALRHPDVFTGFVSMSGVFDLSGFLSGYNDQDCYLQLPTHYVPRIVDPWYLNRFRQGSYTLVTGRDDQCLAGNQAFDQILTEKAIPHQFHIWESENSHDWPTWQKMAQEYL
jgi:esterase/lipase superfamily enzyme